MAFTEIIELVIAPILATDQNTIDSDPATYQLVYFKNSTEGKVGVLTTESGAPVSFADATNTLNTELLDNEYFMDSSTHLNREKIPERIVHAKGAGAFGYFTVTHKFISNYCKADFLSEVGKITPIAGRFSTASGERGSNELEAEQKALAIKLYTTEGNMDLLGINIPLYFYKDPILFPSFVHAGKRNPVTNLFDPNSIWDLFTLHPESLPAWILIFSGHGTPLSYRHMPSFPIHTYQVENAKGETHFMRFHIIPDAGIKNFGTEELHKMKAKDPDYYTRDLYQHIANGDYPSWTVSAQILTLWDVRRKGEALFDSTKIIPEDEFPLRPFGKIVFNRNPVNYFAQIEQMAFSPGNLVSGFLGSPDKLYQARRMAYRDAELYRLGGNFKKIPVNCPIHNTMTYDRDGVAPVGSNGGSAPNYYPNSYNGPEPSMQKHKSTLIKISEKQASNLDQARYFYSKIFSPEEKQRVVDTFVEVLTPTIRTIQERAVKIFTEIHPDLGLKISQGLNITINNYLF